MIDSMTSVNVFSFLDIIPKAIELLRTLILKLILVLNLPEQPTFPFVAGAIALICAWFWFRQWVTTSVFLKLSILLNYLLLALLVYVLIVYV